MHTKHHLQLSALDFVALGLRSYSVEVCSCVSLAQYLLDLEAQVEEKKRRQDREKQLQIDADLKREREAAQYSYFGKPGGGAPLRDETGNVRTRLCACEFAVAYLTLWLVSGLVYAYAVTRYRWSHRCSAPSRVVKTALGSGAWVHTATLHACLLHVLHDCL